MVAAAVEALGERKKGYVCDKWMGAAAALRSCPVWSRQATSLPLITYQAEVLHDGRVHLLVHLARLQLAYQAAALVGEEGLRDM